MKEDIRWKQRLENYQKALKKLTEAIKYFENERDKAGSKNSWGTVVKDKNLDIAKEGLIQRFEYTVELAWQVMKDYAEFQGNQSITGSRDAIRASFASGLVKDGELWMDMLKSRNKTSHTYNEETANEIFISVIEDYYAGLKSFEKTMVEISDTE